MKKRPIKRGKARAHNSSVNGGEETEAYERRTPSRDVFDQKKRSEVMSLIKSKNSKAELTVFRYLRKNNVYFQKHYKRAAGTPDLALPRKKRAVFIDGDFWHGRTYEKILAAYGETGYWTEKIRRNMRRDSMQRQQLQESGWSVLCVWESDINRKRSHLEALEKIHTFLKM